MSKNPMKIVWALIPVAAVAAVGAYAAEPGPESRSFVNRVDLGRQEVEGRADAFVRKGNELLAKSEYFAARDQYILAIEELKKYDTTLFRDKTEYCRKQIARCYFSKATDAIAEADRLATSNDYEEAIRVCREALKYCPEQSEKLEALIAKYEDRRNKTAARESYSEEKLMPNLNTQEYQVQILMEQGRKLVAIGEYGAAMRKFQEVLLINPYNADAIKDLQGLSNRIGDIGEQRYYNSRRRDIAEQEWKNTIPITPEDSGNSGVNVLGDQPKTKRMDKSEAIRKKLESIVIPRIEFEEFTVDAALRYLREQSRLNDPDGVGVDIFQIVPPKSVIDQQQASAAAATGEEETEAPAPAAEQAAGQPEAETTISMEIVNKSLLVAIEELCRIAKLNSTIDDHGVVITSRDVELGDTMEARNFSFTPEDKDPEAMKAKFAPYEIDFPKGSDIFFDDATGRLVVINTPENLRRIELAIADMEAPEVMIQIMLKFVEISQTDLNELAFNWQVAVNANKAVEPGANPNTSAVVMKESSNELLRYYKGDQGTNPYDDATLHYAWSNSDGTEIIAEMFALNWADSKDVLASPRITTLADQAASVEMVKKQYFPSDFDLIDIEDSDTVSGWHMSGADPQPSLDNEQELGIKFTVTPSLKIDPSDPSGEARVISAHITFPIKTFHEWMIFDARSTNSSGDTDGEYYQMPIFDERTIDTDIELYDGQTIVLGGVTSDKTELVHDKIPILGDIPLIGRFFRSEYTNAEKSNLLVFMTCRLVKPDGTARYPDTNRPRGLPVFNRVF